jgi:hypothetical protein
MLFLSELLRVFVAQPPDESERGKLRLRRKPCLLWILHLPRYTGAFCFGRTHTRQRPDGRQVFVKTVTP